MIHSIALLAALAAAPDAAADKPPVPLPAGPPRGMVSHSVEGPAGLGCFRVAPGAGAGLAEAVACPAVSAPPPAPLPPPRRIVRPAQARRDPASLIGPADYPQSALRTREQGTVRFALDVGADGRVAGCTILRSTGSTALDSATCRIMRARARFTPAADSNGMPAASRVEQEFAWQLPR